LVLYAILAVTFLVPLGAGVPIYAQFNTIINVPPAISPSSIGSDTQLNLFDGGSIGQDFDAGAADGSSTNVEVNVAGGTVGFFFEAFQGSTINVSGGNVGGFFDAENGSQVNISGGTVGNAFAARSGSNVNITGGVISSSFYAISGSTVNISGGLFGSGFNADNGSNVRISGGVLGQDFDADFGSTVRFVGNEFRLNGVSVPGLGVVGNTAFVDVPDGAVLTGVLTDGTPFLLSSVDEGSDIIRATLSLEAGELPPPESDVFFATNSLPPSVIRNGQTLVVDGNGAIGDFYKAAPGSTIEVDDNGATGFHFEAIGATVNIHGGRVGSFFNAASESVVNVLGGTISTWSQMFAGATVNVASGIVRPRFELFDGSAVNISGGEVAFNGILLHEGSLTNLYGRNFALDGVEIVGLTPGEPFVLTDRQSVLSGVLADGTSFSFPLTNVAGGSPRLVDGIVTLNFAPETLVGDYNLDGQVNTADYTTWRNSVGQSIAPGIGADGNFDGGVDRADYYVWRIHFGSDEPTFLGPETAPEPATLLLFFFACVTMCAATSRHR
jgi:hypothetical protein